MNKETILRLPGERKRLLKLDWARGVSIFQYSNAHPFFLYSHCLSKLSCMNSFLWA